MTLQFRLLKPLLEATRRLELAKRVAGDFINESEDVDHVDHVDDHEENIFWRVQDQPALAA